MKGKHAVASAPVEAKVKTSTLAALAVGIVISALNESQTNSQLLGSLPPWAQAVVTIIAPPLVTFLSGWQARHTPRPDTGVPVMGDDAEA